MDNQRSSYFDNQFKYGVENSVYQKACNKNLRLLRLWDKVSLENIELTEKVRELHSSLNSLDYELNNLEVNFKSLNKPLISDSCSLSIVSFLSLLFISLFNNLLGLIRRIKEIQLSMSGAYNYGK